MGGTNPEMAQMTLGFQVIQAAFDIWEACSSTSVTEECGGVLQPVMTTLGIGPCITATQDLDERKKI